MTVRKGDVVAIEVEHSSTGVIGGNVPSTRYKLLHIAKVTRASRTGNAYDVQMAGSHHSVKLAYVGKLFEINQEPGSQDAARRLYDTITSPTANEWKDVDAMRAAIRQHFAPLTLKEKTQ